MSNNSFNKPTALLALLALLASGYAVYSTQHVTTERTFESPVTAGLPRPEASAMPSLAPMLKNVLPAVVNIAITSKLPPEERQHLPGRPLRRFHNGPTPSPNLKPKTNPSDPGDAPDEPDAGPDGQGDDNLAHGIGSGVIIDASKGYIITNNHVVDSAETIKVKLKDDREFDAKLIGTDPDSDLAVIQIPAEHLQQLTIADSDQVLVGDYVIAIGSPFALTQSVTAGIVSALGRETPTPDGSEGIQDFIQTDASINPGNSGGALVNIKGELVGIPSQILSGSGGNQGIGFAIPTNLVKSVMAQLIATGKVVRGRLGLGLQAINEKLQKEFDLKDTHGALITKIEPGSTGEKAGIKPKDVVLAADDREMLGIQQLHNYVATLRVGDHVKLKIIRDGKPMEISVEVGVAPERVVTSNGKVLKSKLTGLTLEEVSDGKRRGLLVSTIDPSSEAAKAGVHADDVIVSLDGKPVTDMAGLSDFIGTKKDDKIALQVQREGRLVSLSLP